METRGLPPEDLLPISSRLKLFFEPDGEPKIVKNSRGKRRYPATKTLGKVIGSKDPSFLDFIDRCLHWDYRKRLTPEEALRHDWIIGKKKTR